MGDILRTADREASLEVEALGSAPLERIVLLNGLEPVATVRGYGEADLGARIRVLFEGAEYRGRDRDVHWQGHATLAGNRFTRAQAVNFFNVDRPLRTAPDGRRVDFDRGHDRQLRRFRSLARGSRRGRADLRRATIIERTVRLAEIGLEDLVFEAGGLGRRLRLFRLPEVNRDLAHALHAPASRCARASTIRSTSASPRRTATRPGRARST